MPILPPLSNSEATPPAAEALAALETKLGGRVPNMYRTFAHAPRILDAATAMAAAIRKDLSPKLRELAYLKVVHLTDCEVCRHYHLPAARTAGVSEAQIADLGSYEASVAFTESEKDVLRFAEQWSISGRVAPEVVQRLAAELGAEHLVILAGTVAQANLTCRFNNTFGVELP